MRIWPELRLLGLLRRIAVALEQANQLQRESAARPKSPKVVDIGVAKVEDWNQAWRDLHDKDNA